MLQVTITALLLTNAICCVRLCASMSVCAVCPCVCVYKMKYKFEFKGLPQKRWPQLVSSPYCTLSRHTGHVASDVCSLSLRGCNLSLVSDIVVSLSGCMYGGLSGNMVL